MSVALAELLDDSVIIRMVGSESFKRGRSYARRGLVSKIDVAEDPLQLRGRVDGTQPKPYNTTVYFNDRAEPAGSCSCPVGFDCKHAAALMIAVRSARGEQSRVSSATWDSRLGQLAGQSPARQQQSRHQPVGLMFRVDRSITGDRQSTPIGLGVRPVGWGRSGRWVSSGLSWASLRGDRGFPPRHREQLSEFYSYTQLRSDYRYYGSGGWTSLSAVGPMLWSFLSTMSDAGIPLLLESRGTATPTELVLSAQPAEIVLDVRRSGEDFAIAPRVSIGGDVFSPAGIGWLGSPTHSLFHETAPEEPRRPGTLTIAKLAARPSRDLRDWVFDPQDMTVPRADIDRLADEFYPRLRNTTRITSSDDSVDLPSISAPTLVVIVDPQPDLSLRLRWKVQYAVGEATSRFAVGSDAADEPGHAVRDLAAETALVRALPVAVGMPLDDAERPPVALMSIDAAAFVNETISALRGHDVLVEINGDLPDYRYIETAPVVRVSTSDLPGEADWYDLGVQVTVDDQTVPFIELFAALARDDEFLMLKSGAYFSLQRAEFEALRRLIAEARELQEHEGESLRISKYHAGFWEDLVELGVVENQSSRWAETMAGLLDDQPADPAPVPTTLDAELRPYQLTGFQWLAFLFDHGLGGILADDMGLGKTLQTIALICRARQGDPEAPPFLVVAPSSVVSNWAREVQRFAPHLRVVSIDQTEAKRKSDTAALVAGADIVITSYTLLRIDFESYAGLPWSGLILDEAQFVKNYRAKTYQCVRRLPVPFKLAVTGTPLENSLMDLWAMLSIVAPGLFPRPDRFADTYRKPIERGNSTELLAQLQRRIRPLMLRRTKEKVASELPPKQEQVVEVELLPKHRKIYQTHLQRERQKVLGMINDLDANRFVILRSLTLLRQLALDASLVEDDYANVPSAKVELLCEQLTELAGEGHRALVFSQFTSFLGRIKQKLDAAGVPYCYLDGSTRNRAAVISSFKDGDAPVFLISLKAGGFGLNLTEADYCFVMDPWWNPATETQAIDRAHRIGQDKTVMVYRYVAADTIEEKVMALKGRKAKLFDSVMGGDGMQDAALSAADIRSLFTD
ncbi:SWIM zinc finger protein [Antricoccus suffuscus]|uniref:SWIM zinc finger protein n=1 Tax=Antricoccus suffuscus TaxID=1629062 RepID=A0A2T1A2K3_9ACTN|nr:DEAD/DEAH box helicase [Antricoccus suffuscus]PRZ42840.1 SWIM zinc finger protein [Antricoccus suffuscus]